MSIQRNITDFLKKIVALRRPVYLGFYSFWLDFKLLTGRFPLTFFDRCQFVINKYRIITKHYLLGVTITPLTTKVSLGKRDFYYGSDLGMVVFQTMILTIDKYILPLLKDIENPIIVDVGAHLGFFSVPLAFLLNYPRIYAIEPVSITSRLLGKNTDNIESIKSFNLGLWNKEGKMTIYSNPELLMYSSLFSERFTWDAHPNREVVRLKTLDAFCRENEITSIHLLKIDVEGAEERVLKGGLQTLSKTKYLFIECALDQVDNSTFTSLVSCLYGRDYRFQLVNITSTAEHNSGRLLLVNMLFENLLFKNKKNKQYRSRR